MKQIGTKQFNSNDVMSLHRDMTAVKTLNETLESANVENVSRKCVNFTSFVQYDISILVLCQMSLCITSFGCLNFSRKS